MSTENPQPRPDEEPADPLLDRGATFEALAALLESIPYRPGQVVRGRVGAIAGDQVTVAIEGGEGRVPLAEFGAPPAPGDELDVYVTAASPSGPVLSRDRA